MQFHCFKVLMYPQTMQPGNMVPQNMVPISQNMVQMQPEYLMQVTPSPP